MTRRLTALATPPSWRTLWVMAPTIVPPPAWSPWLRRTARLTSHAARRATSSRGYRACAIYNGFGADSRQHIRGTGSVDATFSAKNSRHHLSAAFGNRQLPQYDHNGLLPADPLFGADNYRVQAFGEFRLPSSRKGHDERPVTYGYLANISGKDDGFSEFYLNRGEMPRVGNYSASFYAANPRYDFANWTTGLTWATTSVKHDEVGFAKNIVDQDGESLEPWMPDGLTHELSWSFAGSWVNRQRNWPRLGLHFNAYNSLIVERPSSQTWSNAVYLQHLLAVDAGCELHGPRQRRRFEQCGRAERVDGQS